MNSPTIYKGAGIYKACNDYLEVYKEIRRVPNGGTLQANVEVGDILWVDPANGDKYFLNKSIYPVSQAVADGLESVGVVSDVDGRIYNLDSGVRLRKGYDRKAPPASLKEFFFGENG